MPSFLVIMHTRNPPERSAVGHMPAFLVIMRTRNPPERPAGGHMPSFLVIMHTRNPPERPTVGHMPSFLVITKPGHTYTLKIEPRMEMCSECSPITQRLKSWALESERLI